jgi:hypothetical protein
MSDNSVLPVSSGTETFANNDIGGIKYPRTKVTWGAAGVANDTSAANPLPVAPPKGQTTMANSQSIAVASDQTPLTVLQGNPNTSTPWIVQGVVGGTALPIQGSVGVVQGGGTAAVVKQGAVPPVAADNALVVAISPNSQNANGQNTMANSSPVAIASNQSAIPVTSGLSAAANGATSSRVDAAATTNATSLKASGGNLINIDLFNVAAYAVFVKFYNKASAPTVGTDIPVWTLPLPAGSGYGRSFPAGKSFSAGIAYAITKLQADTDTTVVVAHDVTGAIDWI